MNIDNIKVGDWVEFDKEISKDGLQPNVVATIMNGRLFKVERVAGQYIHIILDDEMYHLFKGHVKKHVCINPEGGYLTYTKNETDSTETPKREMTDREKARKYVDQMFDLLELTGDKISAVQMLFNGEIPADPPLVLNED